MIEAGNVSASRASIIAIFRRIAVVAMARKVASSAIDMAMVRVRREATRSMDRAGTIATTTVVVTGMAPAVATKAGATVTAEASGPRFV